METFTSTELKIQFPEYSITTDAFQVKAGEVLSIEAPSGFGKTTVLRAILGFQTLEGRIQLGDRELSKLPPHARGIGMVFQDQLLFPNLNALENAGFGLKLRSREQKPQNRERVSSAFEALNISHRMKAPIQELSGGERQKVALIRATVFDPDLLILDEPFRGLDSESIAQCQGYLESFLSMRPIPMIFISHQGAVQFQGVKLIGGEGHGQFTTGSQRHFKFTRT